MDGVVESDRLEHNFSFEQPFVMAAFLKAAVVTDLGPGLGLHIEFCPIASEHHQAFDLFSQLRDDAAIRGVMAFAAFELPMRAFFPTLKIGAHIVAGGTKF